MFVCFFVKIFILLNCLPSITNALILYQCVPVTLGLLMVSCLGTHSDGSTPVSNDDKIEEKNSSRRMISN